MTLLEINDLTYEKGFKKILIKNQLTLEKGQIIGLLGQNGEGKTTLMRLIAGVAKGNKGSKIAINGKTKLPERKALVSYTGAFKGFSSKLKVKEVISFYEELYSDFDSYRYEEMAKFLLIEEKATIGSLSKGMKEQFVLALTLARKAPLYLLDEPFSGIDLVHRQKIMESILTWVDKDSTVLISDHYIEAIRSILDGILILNEGNLSPIVSTDDILENEGLTVEEYFVNTIKGEKTHDNM